ncbi:hypothetical protein Q5752_000780 [Cryptotrichosporon argae]
MSEPSSPSASATPRPSVSLSLDAASNTMPSTAPAASTSPIVTPPSAVPPPAASPGLGLPTARKPAGLYNDHNTCFLNSTFQALSATPPLISLLSANPAAPLRPVPSSLLPAPVHPPALIPALHAGADEPELYPLLPVTREFTRALLGTWAIKEGGGGTSGAHEHAATRSMSLRRLLKEIARKYDQYDDFRQQDAHELLRHLLDSMEMEERDVIKKLQPELVSAPTPDADADADATETDREKHDGDVPQMPLPPPVAPATAEPDVVMGVDTHDGPASVRDDEDKLVPFVDVLFGGLLASVVVCETCKSVSHTYEGFLDISLSLKSDAPRVRKRDRFRAMASRLKPRSSSSRPSHSESAVASDPEVSDGESNATRSRRGSLDVDSDAAAPSNRSFGLRAARPSFSFRRKKDAPPVPHENASAHSSSTSLPNSPPTAPHLPQASALQPQPPGIGPTPAQAAYIRRILYGPPGPPETADPLAKLRAAQSGAPPDAKAPDYGLVDSLKAFTSVEVLEGDNAFACKKCWRIKAGRYGKIPEEGNGEGEGADEDSEAAAEGSEANGSVRAPSIAIDDRYLDAPRLGRSTSASASASSARAPSPLRRNVEFDESTNSIELASVSSRSVSASHAPGSAVSASDGLSDTSSSDEDAPASRLARPRLARTQSKHFVLRRAFKRYLIAKAPEVLVFHFKRFKQTQKSGMAFSNFYNLKKVDDFVSFPEKLDLSQFMAPNRADFKVAPTAQGAKAPYMDWTSPDGPEPAPIMYRLYAVVVHLGTMVGGHYIAYCLVDPLKMFMDKAAEGDADALDVMQQLALDETDGKKDRRVWCHCSDTTIRLATAEEVLSSRAYMCFYEKMSD